MAKKFVVFIDTQVDFMVEGAALYVPGAEQLIGGLNHLAYNMTPDEFEGALFTFDTHYESSYEGSEEAKQFPIHCVYGTAGWQNVINHRLIKIPTYSLRKGVFNMWEEDNIEIQKENTFPNVTTITEREVFFNDLKERGIDTIVLVGVAADFCVKWAADGFLKRGFNVEVPRALTAGIVRSINAVVQDDYVGQNVKVL